MNAQPPTSQPSGAVKPRYTSVLDYVRVVRRRKFLIAAVVVVFTGVATASSATQEDVYQAESSVNVRDVFSDLRFIPGGGNSIPEQGPAQRAALSAEQITSPEVGEAAKRILDSDLSAATLIRRINTQVGIQTNLVTIRASAPEAEDAAATANAFAEAARRVLPRDIKRRLRETERNLKRQIANAREDPNFPSPVGTFKLQLAQIATLRQIAEPVEIATQASVPQSPVSPKPLRAGVLGGILGVIFGLIVAFVRDSLDRRLRTARDVHDGLGLPVLGRVTELSFSSAGLVPNGTPMLEADFEAFRVLRANLSFAGSTSAPRTVLVTSGLPGEGKSTVAMSLASAAAFAGQNVLLVECDLRRPSFERRMKVKRSPGLSDYLEGRVGPREILQTVRLKPPTALSGSNGARPSAEKRDMVCIASGSATGGAADLLTTDRFKDFVEKVGRAYDLVVFDSGPVLAVVDPLEIMPLVDLVLVCARLEQTTHDEAQATRSALEHGPDKPMGAVATGIKLGAGDSGYYYGY